MQADCCGQQWCDNNGSQHLLSTINMQVLLRVLCICLFILSTQTCEGGFVVVPVLQIGEAPRASSCLLRIHYHINIPILQILGQGSER